MKTYFALFSIATVASLITTPLIRVERDCTNASAERASIGSRMGSALIRGLSMIATTQIIKTTQMNADFHHGSTVP